MIKVTRFCAGLKTRHVSIICFALAVCAAVCEGIEVKAVPLQVAECGENVTLSCEATVISKFLISLAWVGNKTCKYNNSQSNAEFQCESTGESTHHQLNLTLINVMPVNQGNYTCKLRAEQGMKEATTLLTVKECLGSSGSYINQSDVTCWFDGVYPTGTIHWFRGDVNLTGSTTTQKEMDQYGRYNVSSTTGVQEGSLNQYKCSLWIPSDGKYLFSRDMAELSSGNTDRLQCIWVMVATLMVKFML